MAVAPSAGMGDRLQMDRPPRYFTDPPWSSQPPTLSGTGNEYQPKCGDALQLESDTGVVYPTCA